MATATRSAKQPVTVHDLDAGWRHVALRDGLSLERHEVLRHHPHPALEPADPSQVLAALTEFDATFPARGARAVALERSAGLPIQSALDQLRTLRASEEILVLADGTGTTREHRSRRRTVVQITERLTAASVEPLPAAAAAQEADRLDRELARTGGSLSEEQRAAIDLACGEHRLVVIEGHAGTGKSTTLTGIARAHQACGREILVTSTAALAAQRLASELAENGITCQAFSTAGLDAAITDERTELTPASTLIHDEAALASTREQIRLLREIEASGARLIAVGDPRQNQPVGAGGLWTKIEHTTRTARAHVELTQNQRARDPADRRDQARFRAGKAEMAIRGYAARDRVHLHPDQQRAEDQALDAAHTDRTNRLVTIVIAQTSNEHLDELNARAQAIRQQHGQLGEDSVPVPGRPYELHEGDHVQVRHNIRHDHGQLRNGTTAIVSSVDPRTGAVDLRLANGTELRLHEPEIAHADLRLAYVQHPFPAQGQTTDTTHLIVTANAIREGTYVALTRARNDTHIYSPDQPDRPADLDRLQQLADRISRTEPELPSIHTPLAHETATHTTLQTTTRDRQLDQTDGELAHTAEPDTRSTEPLADVSGADTGDRAQNADRAEEQATRTWPTKPVRDLDTPQRLLDQELQRDATLSWEP
jgi:ATP-dependent exoDNAse (exonuclease V) alpha subunit